MKKYLNRIRQNKTIQGLLSPDTHIQQTANLKDNSDLSVSQRKLLDIIQTPSSSDGKGVAQMMNPKLKEFWKKLNTEERKDFLTANGLSTTSLYMRTNLDTYDIEFIDYLITIRPEAQVTLEEIRSEITDRQEQERLRQEIAEKQKKEKQALLAKPKTQSKSTKDFFKIDITKLPPPPQKEESVADVPIPVPTVSTVPKVKNSEKTINLSALFNLLSETGVKPSDTLHILNQLNGQEITPESLSEITKLPLTALATMWITSESVIPPMSSTTASQQENPSPPHPSLTIIKIPAMKGEAGYSKTKDESEAGYDIRITMPAIPELGEGAEIGFLQIVQSKKTDGALSDRAKAYNETIGVAPATKESPDSAHGWTIDRQGTPTNPYYGEGIPANYTPGSDKADAILRDHPVGFRPPWSPRFKTCAVIKKCPTYPYLVGTTLATLEWGFDLTPAPPALASQKVFGEPTWIGFKEVHGTPAELVLCARVWDDVHGQNPVYEKTPEIKSFPDNNQPIQPFPNPKPEEKHSAEVKIEIPPTEQKEESAPKETIIEEDKQ